MAMDRNNNPMVATSADCTSSIFVSIPFYCEKIVFSSLSLTTSIHLTDMDGDTIFSGLGEPYTTVIQGKRRLLPRGLRLSSSIELGKIFVYVR